MTFRQSTRLTNVQFEHENENKINQFQLQINSFQFIDIFSPRQTLIRSITRLVSARQCNDVEGIAENE